MNICLGKTAPLFVGWQCAQCAMVAHSWASIAYCVPAVLTSNLSVIGYSLSSSFQVLKAKSYCCSKIPLSDDEWLIWPWAYFGHIWFSSDAKPLVPQWSILKRMHYVNPQRRLCCRLVIHVQHKEETWNACCVCFGSQRLRRTVSASSVAAVLPYSPKLQETSYTDCRASKFLPELLNNKVEFDVSATAL